MSQTTSPILRRDLPVWAALAASALSTTANQEAWAKQEYVDRPAVFTNLSQTSSFDTWINTPILRDFNEPAVSVIKPVEDLGAGAKHILGSHACTRLSSFLSYPPGWAGGKGRAVSTYSLGLLESFLLERVTFEIEPSLFLTRDGFLQLSWESDKGHKIEIEFRADRIEYFLGKNDREGSLPSTIKGLQALVDLLH